MKFRGINHLAMVTNDMDKTIRFYRDVLGMPLVAALGSTPEGRCTPAVTSVGCIELPQIHLAYCIHNEPGQVTLAQPIPHGRRHQVALVSLAAQKVISHSIVPASCFYQLTASPTPPGKRVYGTRSAALLF